MKISLIIPAYNEEKYIKNCLLSVEKYGKEIFEVIVVNNRSTDNTALIVRDFKNVRLINEEKKGLPFARNTGLSHASGDIVAFIDADTMIKAGWVEKIIKEFTKDEKLVSLSGPYLHYDISIFGRFMTLVYLLILLWPGYLIMGYMVTLGNFATRKEAIDKIGGFNNKILFHGDDTYIAKELHKIGKVKYFLSLRLPSSGRRLLGEGYLRTTYNYAINFLWIVFKNKPNTNNEYKSIR
jgi:glycosyltransferase involved in cell wall biosynthesis